jgi:nucleolar protein 15
MDSYLLFNHLLRCKLVPKSQQHENLWIGANRRFNKVPWTKLARERLEEPRTEDEWAEAVETEKQRRATRAEKLKALGYEFEAPELKSVSEAVKNIASHDNEETTAPAIANSEETEEAQAPPPVEEDNIPKAKVAKAKKGKGKKVKA